MEKTSSAVSVLDLSWMVAVLKPGSCAHVGAVVAIPISNKPRNERTPRARNGLADRRFMICFWDKQVGDEMQAAVGCISESARPGRSNPRLFRGVRSIAITLVSFVSAPADVRTPLVVSGCARPQSIGRSARYFGVRRHVSALAAPLKRRVRVRTVEG